MRASHFIISPHDAAGSAARSAIAFYFRSLAEQAAATARGEAEPVHQVRVATRRLRSALRVFSRYVSAIKPKQADAQLKWISTQAGAVRELDIVDKLTRVRGQRLGAESVATLQPLWEELAIRRARAVQKLAAALASRRYKSLAARLTSPVPLTVQGDVPFGSVAAELIAPIVKSMIRAGDRMSDEARGAEVHRLRVRAKRCRYALEPTMGFADPRIERLLKDLASIQDLLGRYHDAAVAADWIEAFARSRELAVELAFACGALTESIRRRERRLKRRALARWERFRAARPERVVLKALGRAQPREGSSDDAVHHAPRTRRRLEQRR